MNASQMLNKDRKANKTFNSSFSPNLKVPKLSYIYYMKCAHLNFKNEHVSVYILNG